jgi:hypothetical protein
MDYKVAEFFGLNKMLAIGYQQPDYSIKYVYADDDTFVNILDSVVYQDEVPSGELKTCFNKDKFFSGRMFREEDTRFRFLRLLGGSWVIKDACSPTKIITIN